MLGFWIIIKKNYNIVPYRATEQAHTVKKQNGFYSHFVPLFITEERH